jgi:ubiquinone biosynthesis protein
MRANFGPEAKVRDVVQNLTHAVERLPDMISDVERTSRMLADGKVKLHPDTIRALRGEDGPSRRPAQVLWLIALGLLAIFVITLID